MSEKELTILGLIHEEVKGVRDEMKSYREEQSQIRERLAVVEDRSNMAKRWGGFGIIGTIVASAVAWFKG